MAALKVTLCSSNPSKLVEVRDAFPDWQIELLAATAYPEEDGDTYLTTVINTEFALGPFGVGLGLPLNLLAINDDATGTRDSKTYQHLLRRDDWNQPQDYLKLVRFVRYGHKRDPVYLLAGQLWGSSLGHGTLVNRYSNSFSLTQRKLGAAFDVNTEYFGLAM